MNRSTIIRVAAPILCGVALILLWEFLVRTFEVRIFVLPPPSAIWASLVENFASLMASLWVTLRITLLALGLAVVGGVALAFLFTTSRAAEVTLFPYAVVLQVTPIVSIAPLILIWVGTENVERAVLILAWIAAFFPILSNTVFGLKSVDPNLRDLFRIYGASRLQVLLRLDVPSALPNFLAGLKISGGLAVIGTVVAEFVAGSGGSTGLAWRLMEASYRLQVPKMFAALLLLSALGIAIFYALSALEYFALRRWHASARRGST
jgi:NitT/TauT family transport system permease protein